MLSDLYIRLRSLFRRSSVDAELADELRFHVEKQAEKYRKSGLTESEARRRARLDFGASGQVTEECREARGVYLLESIARDVRYAWRMLRHSPGFTTVAVLTLAIGIGANTAIFSLVDAIMLRSLPVRDPQQLYVAKWTSNTLPDNIGTSSYGDCTQVRLGAGRKTECSLSMPMFELLRGRIDLFSDAMAFAKRQVNLSSNGFASMAQGVLVSGSYFQTLGVNPALGRLLQNADDSPSATAAVVLSYGLWQERFGGDRNIAGKTIRLNNVVFTVAGVAEQRFARLTPGEPIDLWIPLRQAAAIGGERGAGPEDWWLVVVGRLRAGVDARHAESIVTSLFVNETKHEIKGIWKSTADPRLTLLSAQAGLAGVRSYFAKPLKLLMAAVAIILLIACANVAGLMLARATVRGREVVVRLAIGATTARVVRQLLTESLLLSLLGAGVGTLIAYAGAQALSTFLSHSTGETLTIDLRVTLPVLLFTITAALVTGVGFGLLPALRAVRTDVGPVLKQSSRTSSRARTGLLRLGAGSWLVMLQVALSIVVLVSTGLLLRTLSKLRGIDPGFETRNVLLFTISPSLAGYDAKLTSALYENLQRQLSAVPGVDTVSYSSFALLDSSGWTEGIRVDGQSRKAGEAVQMLSVGPDFFKTMHMRLNSGRSLNQADMSPDRHGAVVNRAFVRTYLDGRPPLGVHFGGDGPKDEKWEIVGVIADTKYASLREADAPTAYVPLRDHGATFALRTKVAPTTIASSVRSIVHQAASDLPVMNMRTQSETIDRLLFNERLLSRLFGLFGLVGLVLACIGVYGLLAYEVSQRTREIGIRRALGAQSRDALLLVLRRGIGLVFAGSLIGVAAALGVTRLLTNLLFEVQPNDPLTFASVTAVLLGIGALACFLPAKNAACVDPATALRHE